MSTSLATRVPVAPGLPLLGNALAAYRDPCRVFVDAYRACGPAFQVRYPGRRLTILAGREANALLATDTGRRFSMARTYATVSRELGTTGYPNAHDGAAHRELRQVVAPSLSPPALEPFLPRVYALVDEAVRAWPSTGGLPLSRALGPTVADAVAVCTIGRPLGRALARDADLYGTMMGVVGVGAAFPAFTLFSPPVQRARRRLAAFVNAALDDHRARPPTLRREADLLDALLAATARAPGRLDPRAVEAMAMLPFKNAGIYLYRFLSFAAWELLARPELLEAVRAEVDAAFAWGPPGVERLRRMETLQSVMLEVLRLYPMAIALPRVLAAPLAFAGHAFDAGATVYFAAPVTHFLPECFPDPERFDLGRYAPGREAHRDPVAWAPFGLGPHACMAKGFSLTLGAAILAGLLRAADVEIEGPRPTPGARAPVRGLPVPIPEARFRVRRRGLRTHAPAPRGDRHPDDVLGAPLPTLTPAQRREVYAGLGERTAAPGTVLFRPGDPADAFWTIRSGSVECFARGDDGAERVVTRLGKGAHFGDAGLLHGTPRVLGARVVGPAPALLVTLEAAAYRLLAVDREHTAAEVVRLLQRHRAVAQLGRALPNLKLDRLGRLGASGRVLSFAPGATVFAQGDVADLFYVLTEGAVEIAVRGPTGEERVVAWLEAPECFGEIGLLNRTPRTATVRVSAGAPARVLAFDERAFSALAADSTGTGADLVRVAGERLAQLSEPDEGYTDGH